MFYIFVYISQSKRKKVQLFILPTDSKTCILTYYYKEILLVLSIYYKC